MSIAGFSRFCTGVLLVTDIGVASWTDKSANSKSIYEIVEANDTAFEARVLCCLQHLHYLH